MQSYGNLPLTCTYEDFLSLFSSFLQVKGEFHNDLHAISGNYRTHDFFKIMRPVITGCMIFFFKSCVR